MANVYVREDGSSDYTTLSAAITANETDIFITGRWFDAEDSAITIDDASTTIEAVGDAKHPGYVGQAPSHYRLRPSGDANSVVVNAATVTLKGLDLKRTSYAGDLNDVINTLDDDNLTIDSCIIWQDDGQDYDARGIDCESFSGSAINLYVTNCIIYGFYDEAIYLYSFGTATGINAYINSCTIWNCSRSAATDNIHAFESVGTLNVDVFNTINMVSGGACFDDTLSPSWDIDYCIESDGSADTVDSGNVGTLNSHNITDDNTKASDGDWVIVQNITTFPYDLRLVKNTYNEAREMHSSTTGAGLTLPNTDIRGRGRGPSPYDCGAYDIPAVVKQSGGDYSTLGAAIVGEESNIEIQGAWTSGEDTTGTLDEPYCYIEAVGEAKHPGYVGSSPSHFRLRPTTSGYLTLNAASNTTIKGIDSKISSSNTAIHNVMVTNHGGDVTFEDCIIWGSNGTNHLNGVYVRCDTASKTHIANFVNCIFFGHRENGIRGYIDAATSSITLKINSCTLWDNNKEGNSSAGGIALLLTTGAIHADVFNTICVDNGNVDFYASASPTWEIHYCIDSDGSITTEDSDGVGNLTSHNITDDNSKSSDGDWVIVHDITTSPYDLRLLHNTYNEAQDFLSIGDYNDLVVPGSDIAGNIRYQDINNFDCGASEIRSSLVVYVREDGQGDYTSLASAVAANETDIRITGQWSSGEDSTISISSTITIEALDEAKHPGYVGSSPTHFRLRPTTASHTIQISSADNCLVKGLDIRRSSNSGVGINGVKVINSTGVDIEDCIIWQTDTDNYSGAGVESLTSAAETNVNTVENCIIYGWYINGILGQSNNLSANLTLGVNSCSLWDNNRAASGSAAGIESHAISGSVDVWVYNTFCMDSGNADYYSNGSGASVVIDYCIASDASIATEDPGAVGCLASHNITGDNSKSSDGDWVIVEDITTSPYDLRLQDNDYNEAHEMHAVTSGAGLTLPNTDIRGRGRGPADYDCGAYDIPAIVKSSGGDYTTLASAITANEENIEIQGTWSSGEGAWVTIDDAYTYIEAVGESRHPGYVGSTPTHFRLRPTSSTSYTIYWAVTGVVVDGIDFKVTTTDVSARVVRQRHTSTIKNCIIWGSNATNHSIALDANVNDTGVVINIENCTIFGNRKSGIGATSTIISAVTVNIKSCTIWDNNKEVGSYAGISASSDSGNNLVVNVFNTICVDNGAFDFDTLANTPTWNIHYCIDSDNSIATEDSDGIGNLASHNITDDDTKTSDGDWVIVEDITTSPYDLRLVDNAYNEAENRHQVYRMPNSDIVIPDLDIVGTLRFDEDGYYDVGAFEWIEEDFLGEVVWGHDTSPDEANIRDFSGNWTGSGYMITGSGDNEVLQLEDGGYAESEDWAFGAMMCQLLTDKYQSGYGSVTVKYKNSATEAGLTGESWNTYSAPFACLGWLKVRVEA